MGRVSGKLGKLVRERARAKCEYCHFPEAAAELPFHFDHIIAGKHNGQTALENLSWACFSCNLHKGSNIAGIDPTTGELCRLFNPRNDSWADHFLWEGAQLRGMTKEGRTTIEVLKMNEPGMVSLRESLRLEGLFE